MGYTFYIKVGVPGIPTTLKYLPLFPVSEGDAVEIMGVIVLGGSCSSNRGDCPLGNYPT